METDDIITSEKKAAILRQVRDLKEAFDGGSMTLKQYNERKTTLIDQLTGTSKKLVNNAKAHQTNEDFPVPPEGRSAHPCLQDSLTLAGLQASDNIRIAALQKRRCSTDESSFSPPEKAVRHTFDPKTHCWSRCNTEVRVHRELLGKAERKAFRMQDLCLGSDHTLMSYVAKVSVDDMEDRNSIFMAVEDRMYAREWARKYNKCNPPKRVDFVEAWLLELTDRPDIPLCAVEHFLAGNFRKYNDKDGFAMETERNTPHAFSHFSYSLSYEKLLICNIKGVGDKAGDLYTDPKICVKGDNGGCTDSDYAIIENFKNTHLCNAICCYLRLPPINENSRILDGCTIPSKQFATFTPFNRQLNTITNIADSKGFFSCGSFCTIL